MASIVVNGNTYTDTGSASGRDLRGADGYGHTRWLLPMLGDAVADIGTKRDACAKAVADALSYKSQMQAAAADANASLAALVAQAKSYRDAAASRSDACVAQYDACAAQSRLAADWAGKMGGAVDGEQFSARHYAEEARVISQQVKVSLDRVEALDAAAFDARLRLFEALTFFSI